MILSTRLRLANVLFWIVLILALVYVTLSTMTRVTNALMGSIALTEAVEIRADGSRQPVALPIRWRTERWHGGSRSFEFTLPPRETDAPVYGEIRYYEQAFQAFLGEVLIYDSTAYDRWSGPFSLPSGLFLIDGGKAEAAGGILRIRVSTSMNPPGALSPLRIGPISAFRESHMFDEFLANTVKPMLVAVQLFLAFLSLLVFSLRPTDTVFAWLGAAMVAGSFAGLGTFSQVIPNIELLTPITFLTAPAVGAAIVGFSIEWTGRKAPKWMIGAAIAATIGSFILPLLPGLTTDQVAFYYAMPFMFVALFATIMILGPHCFRHPRLETVILVIGFILSIIGVLHDYGIRSGWRDPGIFIAPYSRFVSLVAIAIYIVRHQAMTSNALDRAAFDLRMRLTAKEAELAAFYEQKRLQDEAKVVDAERSRITADLHDGVAGQLAAIVALSDQNRDMRDEIRRSARNALLDLRLVIDALSTGDETLLYYLGLFRNRCVEPLEHLGIEIDWSMTRLPEMPVLPRERALNILRILQEAVGNALRHGDPERIEITGSEAAAGQVMLVVRNRGRIPETDTSGGGMGLVNMDRRAREIGGQLQFRRTDDGGEVVLTFPVSQD